MKKKTLLSILIILSINIILIEKSFGQCSDLSINTMYYDTFHNNIEGEILNDGNWYVIYPILKIAFDSNIYISSDDQIIRDYLDNAGGVNDGKTSFLFQSTLLLPFNSIPLNTIISGTITVTDPMNINSFCVLPFQWQIRSETLSTGVTEHNINLSLKVYPNPLDSDNLTINLNDGALIRLEMYDALGKLIKESELNYKSEYSINLNGLNEGIYFIRVLTDKGWINKKIIKM